MGKGAIPLLIIVSLILLIDPLHIGLAVGKTEPEVAPPRCNQISGTACGTSSGIGVSSSEACTNAKQAATSSCQMEVSKKGKKECAEENEDCEYKGEDGCGDTYKNRRIGVIMVEPYNGNFRCWLTTCGEYSCQNAR